MPTSIWTSATVPSAAASTETSPIELGLRFKSDVAGKVSGVRFYKSQANQGTHLGRLWSAAGALLGTRHVHQRERDRVAAGQLRHADRNCRRPDVRRVVLFAAGWLLRRRRLLQQRRGRPRSVARPQRSDGRRQRRLLVRGRRRLPVRQLGQRQLLGRPDVRGDARRTIRRRPLTGAIGGRRRPGVDGHRDVRRGDQSGNAGLHPDRTGRRRCVDHGVERHDQGRRR